jgi:hypothetical protein
MDDLYAHLDHLDHLQHPAHEDHLALWGHVVWLDAVHLHLHLAHPIVQNLALDPLWMDEGLWARLTGLDHSGVPDQNRLGLDAPDRVVPAQDDLVQDDPD